MGQFENIRTMKQEIEKAIKLIEKRVSRKSDAFLVLSALNLLNAAIKIAEYKGVVSYGLIKPAVSRFVQFCMLNNRRDLVDEIYYNTRERCVYIRCFDIQFSFHNIDTKLIGAEIMRKISNDAAQWDGVRLQPMAKGLYELAKECSQDRENDVCIVVRKFKRLRGEAN